MKLINARVVLDDAVVDEPVTLSDGLVAEIGGSSRDGYDCGGDYLIPGLIDLHTDNLERHYMPRAGVDWNPVSASVIHDDTCIAGGITTVFDSLALGVGNNNAERERMLLPLIQGLDDGNRLGLLSADHRLHLRCEVTDPDLMQTVDKLLDHPAISLMSLMDHTPGDRQYPDMEKYRKERAAWASETQEQVDQAIEDLLYRSQTVGPAMRCKVTAAARERSLAVASHDDASTAHIEEAAGLGVTMAEFPTTLAAAEAARQHGMQVIMGAPNLMRGQSYSGNVSAAAVFEAGLLNILASDYVPRSMLEGAFRLHLDFGAGLPEAVALVTQQPAKAVGLEDRGTIAPGLRADLVQVAISGGHPRVKAVWVAGQRVR